MHGKVVRHARLLQRPVAWALPKSRDPVPGEQSANPELTSFLFTHFSLLPSGPVAHGGAIMTNSKPDRLLLVKVSVAERVLRMDAYARRKR